MLEGGGGGGVVEVKWNNLIVGGELGNLIVDYIVISKLLDFDFRDEFFFVL